MTEFLKDLLILFLLANSSIAFKKEFSLSILTKLYELVIEAGIIR